MMDARSLARAEVLGIRSVPAVVIDGKLASNAGGGYTDLRNVTAQLSVALSKAPAV